MSSRYFQNVFKTFRRHFQDVFKTSSRRLATMSSSKKPFLLTVLVNTFSRCLRDVFKTFLRRTAKTAIYRRICLCHTSEKFMVSVQNLQGWQKFLKFKFLILLHLLVAAYRGVFRTCSNRAFLRKYLTILSCELFSQKSCIADVRLGWK